MRCDSYRGWEITFSNTRPLAKVYVAKSKGVELSAGSRVAIERLIDQRLRDDPPNDRKD